LDPWVLARRIVGTCLDLGEIPAGPRSKYLFPEKTVTRPRVNIDDMISNQSLLEPRHNQLAALVSRIAQGIGLRAEVAMIVSIIGWHVKDRDYCEPDRYATETPFLAELWPR
jgi:hypothetical protein